MQDGWNHGLIVGEIDFIMGNIQRDPRMPRERLRECHGLRALLTRELKLSDIDFPKHLDDLLELTLREVVDSNPDVSTLFSARQLLGLTQFTAAEIREKLQDDRAANKLRSNDRSRGYLSKAVRQHLAAPEVSIRTAQKRQKDTWAPAVADGLYHLLDKHSAKLHSIAIRLGIINESPTQERISTEPIVDFRNKGDLKLWAGVANVTRGDTTYVNRVTARSDDVVKIQMTYESAALTKALRDFVPRFQFSSELGRKHDVIVAATAARGRHVAKSLVVVDSTVRARLIYIAGSAKWRRNSAVDGAEPAYETTQIEDSVTGTHPTPIDNVLPGRRHRATVTVLARVICDMVKIRLEARSDLTKSWRQDIAGRAGGVVHLRLEVRNVGNRPLKGMFAYCNVPEGAALMPGSVSLTKVSGEARRVSDDLVRPTDPTGRLRHPEAEDGLSIGTLSVGETVNVNCEILIEKSLKVGSIVTVASVVRSLGMNEFYNTVKIVAQR